MHSYVTAFGNLVTYAIQGISYVLEYYNIIVDGIKITVK